MTSARHLGLDLGGTQLKWAVGSSADGIWDRVATDLVPTRVDAGRDQVGRHAVPDPVRGRDHCPLELRPPQVEPEVPGGRHPSGTGVPAAIERYAASTISTARSPSTPVTAGSRSSRTAERNSASIPASAFGPHAGHEMPASRVP